MSTQPRILTFAGSLRAGSYNKMLARFCAKAAEEAGATATFLDLAAYPMPLFNQDLEEDEGMPANARRFKDVLREHDGLIIASPEYNSTITAALKNVIDWATRPDREGEPALECFDGKTAALVGASPGALGGLRALFHVRDLLQNIKVHVVPPMHAIGAAYKVFDDAGELTDETHAGRVRGVVTALVETTRRLA